MKSIPTPYLPGMRLHLFFIQNPPLGFVEMVDVQGRKIVAILRITEVSHSYDEKNPICKINKYGLGFDLSTMRCLKLRTTMQTDPTSYIC